MWESQKVIWEQSPTIQLSFHSDAGGTEQCEPLKCKFPVQSVKVEEKDHNWGCACVCQLVLFVHMLITDTSASTEIDNATEGKENNQ